MDQITLDVSPTASLHIQSVAGDLRVTGWDRPQLAAESDGERSLHVEQQGDALTLRADGDCTVRLPRGAALRLDNVSGEARLKNLDGAISILNVSGDLSLRQTGPVDVQSVSSDLSAKKIAGHLKAQSVSGDVLARSVAGDFEAGAISGDLYLREIEGGVRAQASGDVSLTVDFAPGQEYDVRSSSDIVVRLAADASGRFELDSSSDINLDVTGAQMEGSGHQRFVTLGSGEPLVRLEASGDITLTGLAAGPDSLGDFGDRFGEDFGVMAEELAAQIETQIGSQMADFNRLLSERLANLDVGATSIRAEEIASKARRAAARVEQAARRRAERQTERAQRMGETAQRRAQREAERAQRLSETARRRAEAAARRTEARHAIHVDQGRSGAWAFGFTPPRPPVPPVPPVPPAEPVSDDERMVILRMVEQGKISVADAEKLLSALEGK
jgi:hypothetical protein